MVELLCAIGIIGILLAMVFPAAQAVRQAARRSNCLSNIRQVMVATLTYESNGNGFPVAGGKGASLIVPLLPYMDETKLADQAKQALLSGENYEDRWQSLCAERMSGLLCPASGPTEELVQLNSQGAFATHYFGVAGPAGFAVDGNGVTHTYKELKPARPAGPIGLGGLFSPQSSGKFRSQQFRDIIDGNSYTLAYGEISGLPRDVKDPGMRSGWAFGAKFNSSGKVLEIFDCKTISKGINESGTTLNDLPFRSNHPGGAQFAMVDGSVHFIHATISLDVLKTLASIAGREKSVSTLEL